MTTRICSVAAVAAALVVAGCGGADQATQTETSTTVVTRTSPVAAPPPTSSPTTVIPGMPAPVLEPFVLTVNGKAVTVSGDVAEQGIRTAVLDAIAGAIGPDANVVDTMKVNPGSTPFDPAQVADVLNAAKPVASFGLRRDPDKVTLTGKAPSQADRVAVETAAKALFPDLAVTNDITV